MVCAQMFISVTISLCSKSALPWDSGSAGSHTIEHRRNYGKMRRSHQGLQLSFVGRRLGLGRRQPLPILLSPPPLLPGPPGSVTVANGLIKIRWTFYDLVETSCIIEGRHHSGRAGVGNPPGALNEKPFPGMPHRPSKQPMRWVTGVYLTERYHYKR